jgi:hypothetical protein
MPALFLTLIVVLYRVILGITKSSDLNWLHNFSPFSAVVLCGAIFFPRRWNLWLPLAAFFISDLIMNVHYGIPLLNVAMIPQYLALGLICGLGVALRKEHRPGSILFGSALGSVVFYLITNTGAWLASADYAHNLSGWARALTVGQPGYPSTLIFYRHTFVSDLLFTGLFLLCMAWRPAKPTGPALAHPAL